LLSASKQLGDFTVLEQGLSSTTFTARIETHCLRG
jgi:hypothetical protein